MTNIRFFTIKNLKVFLISICVRVLTFCPTSPEFNVALLGTLAHQEKFEPQVSLLSSQSFRTYSLVEYSPTKSSKHNSSEQIHRGQVVNLDLMSNADSMQQEIEDEEVDYRRQLHETTPINEQTEVTGFNQQINQTMDNPYRQLDSNLDEGDFLDASKINESRITTRAVNVKTIETAIFADRALDQKFNGRGGLIDLNKLIMTIMNQVQLIFSFRSMRTPIKINIVRIEHLKDMPDPPSTENGTNSINCRYNHFRLVLFKVVYYNVIFTCSFPGDIDGYLSSFCKWQYNMLLKDKNLAWDHAILLTGYAY